VADDEDLRLNSIERFQKTSDRMLLEVHSHCEVPAGCGGAVLRWVDRDTSIPVRFLFYLDGIGGLAIDGTEPASSRPLIPHGRHVVSVEMEGRGIALVAVRDDVTHPADYDSPQERVMFVSDAGWWMTDQDPVSDDWTKEPDLDVSAWRRPAIVELTRPQYPYHLDRIQSLGALGIGLGAEDRRFYLRRVFEVSR
jgi:hypothetical protein